MWRVEARTRIVSVDSLRQGVTKHGRKVACTAKKKKKNKKDGDGASGSTPTPVRQRIRSDISMSIATQIKLVRRQEEYVRRRNLRQNPVYQKSFRKTPRTLEELQAEREEQRLFDLSLRKRKGDPTLSSLYGSQGQVGSPMLLVDGYNMLSFHAKLRQLRTQNMNRARTKLQDMLSEYGAYTGMRVAVVWDAMGNVDALNTAGFNSIEQGDLAVIFSTATEADTFIIRAVQHIIGSGAPYVIVATSDREEEELAREESAYIMSGEQLMKSISEAKKSSKARLRELNVISKALGVSQSLGNLLAHADIGSEEHVGELAAMRLGFQGQKEMEEAKRLGLNSMAYERHVQREMTRRAKAAKNTLSERDLDDVAVMLQKKLGLNHTSDKDKKQKTDKSADDSSLGGSS